MQASLGPAQSVQVLGLRGIAGACSERPGARAQRHRWGLRRASRRSGSEASLGPAQGVQALGLRGVAGACAERPGPRAQRHRWGLRRAFRRSGSEASLGPAQSVQALGLQNAHVLWNTLQSVRAPWSTFESANLLWSIFQSAHLLWSIFQSAHLLWRRSLASKHRSQMAPEGLRLPDIQGFGLNPASATTTYRAGAPLPAHALRGALSGLLDPGGLQGLPAAATLRLALRVAEAVVGAAADEATPFEDDRPPTLEQPLRSLLCPAPAGAGRVDVGFRCAVALRFLPQAALKAVLGAAKEECKDGGLLDGLCIFGLGGAEGDTPLTTACAEDLAADPCSSATFSPLPRAEGGHSVPGITSNKSWPSMSCEQSSAEHAGDEGARLVQGFVERTGDIQSAALLFCHAAHLERPPAALRRYAAQYASLLARWQMYEQRADLLTLLISRLPTEDAPCNRGLVGRVLQRRADGPAAAPGGRGRRRDHAEVPQHELRQAHALLRPVPAPYLRRALPGRGAGRRRAVREAAVRQLGGVVPGLPPRRAH
ncbi:unnamed protein product, partial [Prorocentrum cordatum]